MGPKRRDVTPVRKKNYNSKREDNKGEDQFLAVNQQMMREKEESRKMEE